MPTRILKTKVWSSNTFYNKASVWVGESIFCRKAIEIFEISYPKLQLFLYLHPFENLFKRREYLKKVLCGKGSKFLWNSEFEKFHFTYLLKNGYGGGPRTLFSSAKCRKNMRSTLKPWIFLLICLWHTLARK
jgi:hypothetical protein